MYALKLIPGEDSDDDDSSLANAVSSLSSDELSSSEESWSGEDPSFESPLPHNRGMASDATHVAVGAGTRMWDGRVVHLQPVTRENQCTLKQAIHAAELLSPQESTQRLYGRCGWSALVSEWIPGVPLSTWLGSHVLPMPSWVMLITQVARALAHMERCGVMHTALCSAHIQLMRAPADVVTSAAPPLAVDSVRPVQQPPSPQPEPSPAASLGPAVVVDGLALHEPASVRVTGLLWLKRITRHATTDASSPTDVTFVKWMAPEALQQRTQAGSSVWSFGVLVYECVTGGRLPHGAMGPIQAALATLNEGFRPQPPPGVHPFAYELMMDCWCEQPKERPTFGEIVLRLQRFALRLHRAASASPGSRLYVADESHATVHYPMEECLSMGSNHRNICLEQHISRSSHELSPRLPPFPFGTEDSPSCIVYEGDATSMALNPPQVSHLHAAEFIKAATAEKLVEKLTDLSVHDHVTVNLIDTFLFVYPSIEMSALDLVNLLVHRFRGPPLLGPRAEASHAGKPVHASGFGVTPRIRVCVLFWFRRWARWYPNDFVKEPQALHALQSFCASLKDDTSSVPLVVEDASNDVGVTTQATTLTASIGDMDVVSGENQSDSSLLRDVDLSSSTYTLTDGYSEEDAGAAGSHPHGDVPVPDMDSDSVEVNPGDQHALSVASAVSNQASLAVRHHLRHLFRLSRSWRGSVNAHEKLSTVIRTLVTFPGLQAPPVRVKATGDGQPSHAAEGDSATADATSASGVPSGDGDSDALWQSMPVITVSRHDDDAAMVKPGGTPNKRSSYRLSRRSISGKRLPRSPLFEMDPVVVAEQLSLLEHSLCSSIDLRDFLVTEWSSEQQRGLSLSAYFTWFHDTQLWVTGEILSGRTEKRRAGAIDFFIAVARACRRLHNYNAVVEILMGLGHKSILRMARTCRFISRSNLEYFSELNMLMNPRNNFTLYRREVAQLQALADVPYVLYVGAFLQDLDYIRQSNSETYEGLVHWSTARLLKREVSVWEQSLLRTYNLRARPRERDYLLRQPLYTPDQLLSLSRVKEGSLRVRSGSRLGSPTTPIDDDRSAEEETLGFISEALHPQDDLTERDWKLLLAKSDIRSYDPGDVIIREGEYNRHLFKIAKGSVCVQKRATTTTLDSSPGSLSSPTRNRDEVTTLATLQAPQTFGDMSILDEDGLTSATVIAKTRVELHRIEAKFIHVLLHSRRDGAEASNIASRFYHMLAYNLAQKLSQWKPQHKDERPWKASILNLSRSYSTFGVQEVFADSGGGDDASTQSKRASLSPLQRSSPIAGSPAQSRRSLESGSGDGMRASSPSGGTVSFSGSSGGGGSVGGGSGGAAFGSGDVGSAMNGSSSSSASNMLGTYSSLDVLGSFLNRHEQSYKERNADRKAQADRDFQGLFGLEGDEIIIKQSKCALRAKIAMHGKLYISQNHVCFYSRVFYKKIKLVLRFADLCSIECIGEPPSELLLAVKPQAERRGKKKTWKFVRFEDLVETYDIALSLWKHEKQAFHFLRSVHLPQRQQQRDMETVSSFVSDQRHQKEDLSKEDWDVLLAGAKSRSYSSNDVMLAEGDEVPGIFQVARGSCRIEKEGSSVGLIQQGEIFGEISFLKGGTASASILGDSDAVDVYVIDRYYVTLAFNRHPGLEGRFYRYLATIVASRLRDREGRNEVELRRWKVYRGRQQQIVRDKVASLSTLVERAGEEGCVRVQAVLRDLLHEFEARRDVRLKSLGRLLQMAQAELSGNGFEEGWDASSSMGGAGASPTPVSPTTSEFPSSGGMLDSPFSDASGSSIQHLSPSSLAHPSASSGKSPRAKSFGGSSSVGGADACDADNKLTWAACRAVVSMAKARVWKPDIMAHDGLKVLQDLAHRKWPQGENEAWKYAVYTLLRPSDLIIEWSKPLGSGAFSTVYEGRVRATKERVAVKELQQQGSFDPSLFRRELVLMSMLNHKHVLRIDGCFQDRGKYYIVSPLAIQGSLADVYARKTNELSPAHKIKMLLHVAKGLVYLHSLGVVHRDVKSSNVLVMTERYRCVLGDLGISRTESRTQATATKVIGTLAYFAPELYRAHVSQTAELRPTHSLHKEADIYSLGYVMWELFYEAEAYSGYDYVDILPMKEQDDVQQRCPLEISETCPWKEIMLRCWAHTAEDRPTAHAVAVELKHLRRIFTS